MSVQKSDRPGGVVVQKPSTNVYTVMLIIALVALVVTCVLLFTQLSSYGDFPPWTKKLTLVGDGSSGWPSMVAAFLTGHWG